jgi:hypothetical protein
MKKAVYKTIILGGESRYFGLRANPDRQKRRFWGQMTAGENDAA